MFYPQIKLWVWKMEQANGTLGPRWNRWQYIYKPEARVDVFIDDINSNEKLSRLCRELLYDGVFVIRQLIRSRKNLTGWKWKRVALVNIMNGKVAIRNNKLKNKFWWEPIKRNTHKLEDKYII